MSTTIVFAAVGAKALLFLYVWLLSSIIASELSRSKGYGEKPGLGTGLLLTALAPIIWLFIPPKDDLAEWHTRKPWQRRRKPRESEMAAAMAGGPATESGGAASQAQDVRSHDQQVEASGAEAGESTGTGGAGSRPGE